MKSPFPANLSPVDPSSRMFPADWKDQAIFIELRAKGSVTCSLCSEKFIVRADLRLLEADHIKPFSKGGLTVWENLQLLWRPCNRSKSARVASIPGGGDF